MPAPSSRFQTFTHPCREPVCRERQVLISYGLSKDQPTVLQSDRATCPVCHSTYSLRLGPPEATGVRVFIKQLPEAGGA
jgi:hypothetical protein